MSFPFEWNSYADQPHNVAPKSERLRYHLRHAGAYFALAGANLRRAWPALARYRRLWKDMYGRPATIGGGAVACAVSETGERGEEIAGLLADAGVGATLVRAASWERDELGRRERFVRLLRDRGIEVTLALIQRRDDVLDAAGWRGFLEEVFDRFGPLCPRFEIGHAWNRTKWGVWSHREYLGLAKPAFEIAPRAGVKLVGPAVIDFEFHLYPVTLPRLPFDKISSLLYVDRVGAPENKQFGWSASRKLALLRGVVDASGARDRGLWITEVNWPLAGTGPWSPAAGRPNVGEGEQADYLVRYYVLMLASGLVERVYWWQLAAPGYGLIDSREEPWRRRPAFHAFRRLRAALEGSEYLGVDDGAGERGDRNVASASATEAEPKEPAVEKAEYSGSSRGLLGGEGVSPQSFQSRVGHERSESERIRQAPAQPLREERMRAARRRLKRGGIAGPRALERTGTKEGPLRLFRFRGAEGEFAIIWTTGPSERIRFNRPIRRIVDRDGREVRLSSTGIEITGSPLYVYFGR